MLDRRARILVVDNSERTLTHSLKAALIGHEVEIARDAFDAIYQIDCAGRPHDVIFCDLARNDLPGPELWAYLSLGRAGAAQRMVFVASKPLGSETHAFLDRIPNPCVVLPADPEALDALVTRRVACGGPGLARFRLGQGGRRSAAGAGEADT